MLPFLEPAFSNGEITPSLFGRIDIEKFHTAAGTIRNAYVDFRGGCFSRPGTAYALISKQSFLNNLLPPRLITFNFSLAQQYCLEFGDNYMRIYSVGAPVVEPGLSVLNVISIQPTLTVTVPSVAGNLAKGDWVLFSGAQGMTDVNGNVYVVGTISGTQVPLLDFDGNRINANQFGVYTGGGILQRIYTVPTPYLASDIWIAKFKQSANVMTIVNPNFPPYNLSRFGPLNWQFLIDVRAPQIGRPQSPTAVANVPASSVGSTPPPQPAAYAYQITAVSKQTGEESEGSAIANVVNSVDMASTLGSITINWSPVAGAAYYNVYRAPTSYATAGFSTTPPANALPVPVGSLFGVVAQSIGPELVDTNLTPDFQQSPPQGQDPLAPGQVIDFTGIVPGSGYNSASITMNTTTGSGFIGQVVIVNNQVVGIVIVNPGQKYAPTDTATITSGSGTGAAATPVIGPQTGTYPSVVSYFQQRRVFANSFNQPDTYWMSQTGNYDNFDVSIPIGPTDAITGTPSAETVDGIQWMLEMPLGLVTFTGAQILQITSAGTFITSPTAITPENQVAVPQSTVGSSSTLEPIRIEWNILHYEPDDAILRELNYQLYFNIYLSKDISWQSAHLLFGHRIVDRAWTRKPNYVLWHVREDGVLLSTTYVKDQEVCGWAKHTTQGQFVSATAVFEDPIDALYVAVQRPVLSGAAHRWFIERMDDRLWFSAEDPWCIDNGVGTNVPLRSGTLYANNASGNVSFTSGDAVFVPADVGATIRMGGGIAVVTNFDNAGQVDGTWVYPCQQIIPDSPTNQPVTQPSGNWSIRGQVRNVTGLPPYSQGRQLVGMADGIPIGAGSPTGPIAVTVAGGSVATAGEATIPFPASYVKLGLGFGVQVQSIYLDVPSNPTVQGRVKAIDAITCRVKDSSAPLVGANQIDASTLSPQPLAVQWPGLATAPVSPDLLPAPYVSPGTFLLAPANQQMVQPLYTGDIRINIPAIWRRHGQAAAQQTLPLPLNLLAFIPEFDEGDLPETSLSQRPPRAPEPLAGMIARFPQQARR